MIFDLPRSASHRPTEPLGATWSPGDGAVKSGFSSTIRRVLLLLTFAAVPAWADCPRIVSQAPYLTRALQWLGLGPCIVGVGRYDREDLPRTGGVLDPDVEAIAALKPDLAVNADWIAANAWRAAVPAGARALRLGGFASMAEVERMLHDLAEAAGDPSAIARAREFGPAWRQAAARIGGKGQRVLLVSACSGAPYSFGRRTWLNDLFTAAGFSVVDDHDKIRHLQAGEEIPDLETLVDRTKPQILFAFTPAAADACDAALGALPVRVVGLEGNAFLHPGPALLQGLIDLEENLK